MSSIFDGMAAIFRDTFGDDDPFTYTTARGTVAPVRGIFEEPSALLDDGQGGAGNVRSLPKLSVAAADLPAGHGQGDTVNIRGRDYTVRTVLPDGRGMVELHLDRIG